MQVRITPENETLAKEYVELCRQLVSAYDVSDVALVNLMLTEKLREEIKRLKKKAKE